MKKMLRTLAALILLLPAVNLYAQSETFQVNNRWNLKSIGLFATYGGERFFEPLTFAKMAQNSGSPSGSLAEYFKLPAGAIDYGSRYLDDTPPLGLGFQLAWPVGKKHNEMRAGFAFQDHGHRLSVHSRYNLSPDTIRFHSKSLVDEYVISQASFDYVMYTKPLLKNLRLLWRVGTTFGVSTRHDLTHEETIMDLDTADVHFGPEGSFGYDRRKASIFHQRTSISNSPRLEAGLRTSVGLEIILNIFHQQIGLSGEYGHGLAGEKVLEGGTTAFKRTELGHLQARFFLR